MLEKDVGIDGAAAPATTFPMTVWSSAQWELEAKQIDNAMNDKVFNDQRISDITLDCESDHENHNNNRWKMEEESVNNEQ